MVGVNVDAEVLIDDDPEGVCELDDGPALPAETVRRLFCDASTVAIIRRQHGEPLTVSRRSRTLPRWGTPSGAVPRQGMPLPGLRRTHLHRRPPHPPPGPWRWSRGHQRRRALLVPPPPRARGRLDPPLPRTRRSHRHHARGQRDIERDRALRSRAHPDRATQRDRRTRDRQPGHHTELVARSTPPRRHRGGPRMARRTR